MVIGSGNIAYRLGLNTLVRSADDIGWDRFIGANADMFIDRQGHVDLAEAITTRDADSAFKSAYKQLSQLVELLQT